MTIAIIALALWGLSAIVRNAKQKAAQKEMERIKAEQQRQKLEQQRQREQERRYKAWKAEQDRINREHEKQAAAHEKELARQDAEQRRQKAEQEKQAKQIEKHEQQIRAAQQRIAAAENEIAYNREQRERLFALLDIAELERDAAIQGSSTWEKYQRKVIALNNQIHAVQNRIDKNKLIKVNAEKVIA